MKNVALLLLLCAPLAYSQQQPAPARPPASTVAERGQGPSYSDLYCAGFISKQVLGKDNYIVAAAESPAQTQFHQGDSVYLQGSGYTEGTRYSVVRELHDPNTSRAYAHEAAVVAEVGQPYAEMGRVRVTAVRGNIAIAAVEFSCAPMVQGDLLTPFQEKPPIAFRGKTTFDRFPAGTGSVTARIVMAKDFDHILGTGQKVYISAGADKGVKVGDYFRAVRNYDPARMNQIDALPYMVPQSEETQKHVVKVSKGKFAELPKRALAEMIVLNVTPTSSTAMITFAVESVTPGDTVELEGGSQ